MEKINISELLKDCPSGMELDCLMYEDVYFDYVDKLNIIHCYVQFETYTTPLLFDKHGAHGGNTKSKCVIFPKGKTTWEGFHRPFKDGDIVHVCDEYSDATFTYIAILKQIEKGGKIYSHCFYNFEDNYFNTQDFLYDGYNIRFATEEEKQKLFDAIKANGYSWNAETKTLDKLVEPKFTVGDTIKNKNDKWQAKRTIRSYVAGIGYFTTINDWVRLEDQDNWELIIEPIFKVGNKIKDKNDKRIAVITDIKNDCYFIQYFNTNKNDYQNERISIKDQDQYELVPNKFDISTLKPFESRVLVRDTDHYEWEGAVFGRYDGNTFFTIGGIDWRYCIPYEGNEHLHGTTNDCDDFYKTWKK